MKTFILMWNPSISSYTWERFKADQQEMCEEGWGYGVGNWSVWDHEEASEGDRFFMVKVGPGTNGIVMAGSFSSDPYEDEDWSGHGRQTFYCDLLIEQQIDPDKAEILSSEVLQKEIPDFGWSGGHSGRVLDADSAEKLELLWLKYLNKIRLVKEENAVYLNDDTVDINETLQQHFRKQHGDSCEICGYNYQKVFGQECEEHVDYDFIMPAEEFRSTPLTDEQFISKIHCVCDNCPNIGYDKILKLLNK